MKTLAEQLDEAEREMDEQDALRKIIEEALKKGQKDAGAMRRAMRGTFGYDPSLDKLVLR